MKPNFHFFNFSENSTPRREGMDGRCAGPGSLSPSFRHTVAVTIAVTLVSSAQTNTWSGATSGVLNVSGNYAAGASVANDGNPSALYVFGNNAANRYSLTNGGELKANRFEFTGSNSYTLANSGQFNFIGTGTGITQSSSANQTISGGIKVSDGPFTLGGSGAGLVTLSGTSNDYGGKGVTKSGTSAFLITAAITSPGPVTINGGTLAFSGSGNLASAYQLRGGVIAASGIFSRTFGNGTGNVNFGAGGGGFAAYGGALTVSTSLGTWASTTNGLANNTPLILGSSIANNVVTLSSNLALGGAAREIRLVDNTSSANDSAVMSGVISGTAGGGLNLTGALALSNANTYTGVTTIGSGVTLSVATIGNGGVVGGGNLGRATNAAANLVLNGGTLRYTGATASTDRNFTLGATTASAIHVSNATTVLTMTGASATTTGSINKTGDGVLTLSAANTHTGGTVLTTGTLRATTNAGALGNGTLTLSGGILDLVNDSGLAFGRNTTVTANTQINSRRTNAGAGVTHSLGTLAIGAQTLTTGTDATVSSGTAGVTFGATTLSASGATFTANASTLLTLGAITGTNTGFTVNGAGNTTIGGVIGTGTGTLTKAGAGSLTLLATNTFSGATAINGGLLQVGDGGTIGTLGGGSVGIATGASLRFNRSNDLTVSNVLSGAGGLTKLGGGVLTLTGTNTFSGGTAIDVGSLQVGDGGTTGTLGGGGVAIATGASLRFNRSNDLAVANVLSGAGSVTKLGASALTLTGTNTFTGGTSINSGSVRIAADANLGTGNITLAGGTLAATETLTLGSSRVISLTANSILDVAATKTLTFDGAFSGSGDLDKVGAGTLIIGGSSTYTGATKVSDGRLVVNGNISTSSLTTVSQTGILSGSGILGAVTIEATGTHSPGNSPGIVSTGDYTLEGSLIMESLGIIPGVSYDQIQVAGLVNLSGTLSPHFTGGTYANGNMLFLLLNDGTDAVTGTFARLAQGDIVASFGGFDWQISYNANGDSPGSQSFFGGNDIALMAIPEPSSALLGGLASLLVLRRRRPVAGL